MPPADRGGSTFVRGRIRSPHSSDGLQGSCGAAGVGALIIIQYLHGVLKSSHGLGRRACVVTCNVRARTHRGVGTAGATGALAPAMLKPRGREYLFAPAIFSHIFACCSLNFHSLSLCCLHTIKTSHSVGTTGRILRNKLTKQSSPARISRIE